MIGIIHHLGIKKWVWVTSTPILEYQASYSGLISPPSVVPLFLLPFTNQMSYAERAQNLFMQALVKFAMGFQLDAISRLFQQKFGDDFPTIKALLPTASLHMVNSEELLEYPRPLPHKILFIGGIGMDSPKPLNGEFKEFVSNSKKPIVLVSFGSVAKASKMPKHWIDSLLGLFHHNQHLTFIWKYEGDAGKLAIPENVFVKEWIPQTDLLGNEKIVAFVTHAGYNSINECARAGKPMVLVPLFADQPRNAKLVEYRGLGLIV
uniref:glucuronosyltransferase n=1 Tax=Acrobeloides nanus TaxID=290746 RepID=A0A914C4E8_9BILA